MGHEIETIDRVGLRGEQAWHGLGTVIQDDLSAVDAAERFGLTWPVEGLPLYAMTRDGRYLPVDTHVANYRTADCDGQSIEHLLGVVGVDYRVCQNRELAEFTHALAETGRVTIESCGSLRGGKRVWFLARGEAFTVGDTVDKVYPYILVSNGHDGTQAIRVTPTTVRVVCSNTLHMVIPRSEGERPESAAITIRHSGKISDKLEQARNALKYYGSILQRNRDIFDAMQSQAVEREQVVKLFADTYAAFWEVATPDELASQSKEVRRNAENRLARMQKASTLFLERYDSEKQELGLGDTLWTAFNAMTGFIQHDKAPRGKDDSDRIERRRESNLFGINATRPHEVLAGSLALAS